MSVQLQFDLPELETQFESDELSNGNKNKIIDEDKSIHEWYRFVLSYPPHIVRDYISKFGLTSTKTVLDPFCGTGTTLVECKLNQINSLGIEASPFAHFVSHTKTQWAVNSEQFFDDAKHIASDVHHHLLEMGIDDRKPFIGDIEQFELPDLDENAKKLLISKSISPLPLKKSLLLLKHIHDYSGESHYNHLLLAFANALVFQISNLRFGPEVGAGKVKPDCPVIPNWLLEVQKIYTDLNNLNGDGYPQSEAILGDAREVSNYIEENSIDGVITSPPYPNEKDYSRTTRLESVVLGFVNNLKELRKFKKNLVRSNTRGVYKDDNDDQWIEQHQKIIDLANRIEEKRIDLGKTSGFEKSYKKVTLQYFGGMAKHLANLRPCLKSGANLAYVVGDQASYLQVPIRTGELLADIAHSLNYEVVDLDLFRTRFATATQKQMREEVLHLRWNS